MALTPAQGRALAAVVALADEPPQRGRTTARALARALWPDSPAWQRRARRYDGRPGAVGATMPMKAGALLGRLHEQGMVRWWTDPDGRPDPRQWEPTAAGRRWAAEHGHEERP